MGANSLVNLTVWMWQGGQGMTLTSCVALGCDFALLAFGL